MRLINFGAGERYDRLTILARRLIEGALTGTGHADQNAFGAEFHALLEFEAPAMRERLLLAAANAAIWQREDRLRTLRPLQTADIPEAARLAIEIQQLNDRRARLMAVLNADNYQEKQLS